jgi:hypothetical protein
MREDESLLELRCGAFPFQQQADYAQAALISQEVEEVGRSPQLGRWI